MELKEILRSWAAGREGVSRLAITDIEHKFDEGWPGTDVTPGDVPEIVVQYKVERHVVYRRPAEEVGDFILELSHAIANRPVESVEGVVSEVRVALVNLCNALTGVDEKKLPAHVRASLHTAQRVLEQT